MQNDNFCMDSSIAHMHRTLIKAVDCAIGVMEFSFYAKDHQLPFITSKRSHLVKR